MGSEPSNGSLQETQEQFYSQPHKIVPKLYKIAKDKHNYTTHGSRYTLLPYPKRTNCLWQIKKFIFRSKKKKNKEVHIIS